MTNSIESLAFSGLTPNQFLTGFAGLQKLVTSESKRTFLEVWEDPWAEMQVRYLTAHLREAYPMIDPLQAMELVAPIMAFTRHTIDRVIERARWNEEEELTPEEHIRILLGALKELPYKNARQIPEETYRTWLTDRESLHMPVEPMVGLFLALAAETLPELQTNDYTLIEAGLEVLEAVEEIIFHA